MSRRLSVLNPHEERVILDVEPLDAALPVLGRSWRASSTVTQVDGEEIAPGAGPYESVLGWPQHERGQRRWRYKHGSYLDKGVAIEARRDMGLGRVETLPDWARVLLSRVLRFELLHRGGMRKHVSDVMGDRLPELKLYRGMCKRMMESEELLFPDPITMATQDSVGQIVVLMHNPRLHTFREVRLRRDRGMVEVFMLVEYGRRTFPVIT